MSNPDNKYVLRDHKDEIITGIIKNLIWLPIAAIIPIVWNLLSVLYQNLINNKVFTFSNIIAFIAMVVAVIQIIVSVRLFKKLKSNESKDNTSSDDENLSNPLRPYELLALRDVRVSSLVAEFNIKNEDNIVSTLEYQLIANKDGIESFRKSIIWTGSNYSGSEIIYQNSPEYKLKDLGGNNGYHEYEVLFNKEIHCQDKIEFHLATRVSDPGFTMKPFYGYFVKHQIDSLTIRLVVPPNTIKNVKQVICGDWSRQMEVEPPQIVHKMIIAGNEVYTIKISNPTILYKYFLEWEFTNKS